MVQYALVAHDAGAIKSFLVDGHDTALRSCSFVWILEVGPKESGTETSDSISWNDLAVSYYVQLFNEISNITVACFC